LAIPEERENAKRKNNRWLEIKKLWKLERNFQLHYQMTGQSEKGNLYYCYISYFLKIFFILIYIKTIFFKFIFTISISKKIKKINLKKLLKKKTQSLYLKVPTWFSWPEGIEFTNLQSSINPTDSIWILVCKLKSLVASLFFFSPSNEHR